MLKGNVLQAQPVLCILLSNYSAVQNLTICPHYSIRNTLMCENI